MRVIHWFRRDLRLTDNTALNAALGAGRVIPAFVFDPALLRGERFGLPRLAFLIDGLAALDRDLRARGSALVIRHGDPRAALSALVAETGAQAVYTNRDYSPFAAARDAAVGEALPVPLHSYDDALFHAPEQIRSREGRPYTVFTPFKRVWLEIPKRVSATTAGQFDELAGIEPGVIPTTAALGVGTSPIAVPAAGEATARRRLAAFASGAIYTYRERRNDLLITPFAADTALTSGLSPYLRFGMLSPRQAFGTAVAAKNAAASAADRDSVDIWISELAWRDFYTHILHHFPHVTRGHFRREFEAVPYRDAAGDADRWADGQTGYPIIDAAMRQLRTIGWMHNRARMIVASFLTKHLLLHWRVGETHFMRWLIDGDTAANNGGWQWAAGTGTDAQPYFRIFNPISQSQQFDPEGAYIRHYVPELRDVPTAFIHTPWLLPTPPRNYPAPLVDHSLARQRALAAFQALKSHKERVS